MAEGYDPDAFDSTAVVNAEEWNKSGSDGETLTRADILPNVSAKQPRINHGFICRGCLD